MLYPTLPSVLPVLRIACEKKVINAYFLYEHIGTITMYKTVFLTRVAIVMLPIFIVSLPERATKVLDNSRLFFGTSLPLPKSPIPKVI